MSRTPPASERPFRSGLQWLVRSSPSSFAPALPVCSIIRLHASFEPRCRRSCFCADRSQSAEVELPVIVTLATETISSVADVTNIEPHTRIAAFRQRGQTSRKISVLPDGPALAMSRGRRIVAITMTVVFSQEPMHFGDLPDGIDALLQQGLIRREPTASFGKRWTFRREACDHRAWLTRDRKPSRLGARLAPMANRNQRCQWRRPFTLYALRAPAFDQLIPEAETSITGLRSTDKPFELPRVTGVVLRKGVPHSPYAHGQSGFGESERTPDNGSLSP